jgi:hypothetical protein
VTTASAVVATRDLIAALRQLGLGGRSRPQPEASFEFRDAHLVASVQGVEVRIPATGRWRGVARVDARALRALVRVPPKAGNLEISYDNGRLYFGSWSVNAAWQDIAPPRVDLPINPDHVTLLGLAHAYNRIELENAGLWSAIAGARQEADALLKDAARLLAPLGIGNVALESLLAERVSLAGLEALRQRRCKQRPAGIKPPTNEAAPRPGLRAQAVPDPDLPELGPAAKGEAVNPIELGYHQIRLESGRTIRLHSLEQRRTYAGVLCGYPTRSRLRTTIADSLRAAAEQAGPGRNPRLLPPRITAYDFPPDGGVASDPCQALPAVTSTARFDSTPVGGDADGSALVLVWFQDEWGLPPPQIVAEIQALNWDACASDECW